MLRHPRKIFIGDNVVVDDQCCLDAKGTTNRGIELKDGVFLGRNAILSCKNGDIVLEEEANLGFFVEVASAGRVRVAKRVLIAAYTYLVGGDHLHDRTDIPVLIRAARRAASTSTTTPGWAPTWWSPTAPGSGATPSSAPGPSSLAKCLAFHIAAGAPARIIKDRRQETEDRRPETGN